jgi:hypothetical protein
MAAAGTTARPLRMSVGDLKARLERGKAVTVLDVRGGKAWDDSGEKVRGAIRVSPERLPDAPPWPKDRVAAVY